MLPASRKLLVYVITSLSMSRVPTLLGLRDLAQAEKILDVISPVLEYALISKIGGAVCVPVFVKLAPDFAEQDFLKVLEALKRTKADAII